MKRAISILLSGIFIFTSIPCVYTHPQGLASRSLFKLWEKKGINPIIGLTIEARLRAIHKSILEGRYDPKTLETVDERASVEHKESRTKYRFDYNIIHFNDNRVSGMWAEIYKDKYGKQQLILFYNPEDAPWDILKQYGVRTPEDREFAKRGWWISSIKKKKKKTLFDPTRRILLALIAMAFPALALDACVFDTSGLPVNGLQDGGTKPDSGVTPDGGLDGGVQPTDIVERPIDASIDIGNNPITILQNSAFSTEGTTQRLSPSPQFVRSSNAAFRYNGINWQWRLSQSDRTNILNKGLTYIFNGRNHKVKLIGQGYDGQTKTIIFNTQIPGMTDYTQPYRITITKEHIQQLAQEIGLDLSTINIQFENLEPTEELVLNGFQKQYAVVATPMKVNPDKIGPQWSPFTTGDATINTVSTLEGVNIAFTMIRGDSGQSVGINIQTKSGGIPLSDLDLQGAWKMDGADLGGDSGPNSNSLTNNGGVESAPGRYGNAISLSGGNYLSIDSPIGLNGGTSEQTIVAWVKTTTAGGAIVSKWANIHGGGYGFNIQEGKLIFYYGATGDVFYYLHADNPINDNTWHHTAAVVDGSTVRLYVDGVEVKSGPQEIPLGFNNLDPFMIGQNANYNWPFNGLVDEVAVFDRALTSDEIQNIHNQVDSSNFLTPALITTELNVRGNSPFILRLTDNNGQILDIFILGLDPINWRGIAIDILQAQAAMNPSFNLNNVESVKILVQGTILPVPDGESFNGTIEMEGLIGIPPTTRHRYATDTHDLDITREDYAYLIENLGRAKTVLLETRNGIPVIGITEWQDILQQDGLEFTVDGRVYSAFTGPDRIIYIPYPELIKANLNIGDDYIKNRILSSVERRSSIIVNHELDEIKTPDHREAVFNEFSNNSINGLNYADVVTVLLETLFAGRITTIDESFHRQFIANLLMQGMFLDNGGNTYLRIIKEIVDDRIDEDSLRGLYKEILAGIRDVVSSYRFTHRRPSKEEIAIPEGEVLNEPGFSELVKEQIAGGNIYIDLAKFFVRNDSLATDDEVVTIDFEYLKRFIYSLQRLQGSKINVTGVYSEKTKNRGVIEQLISIIREDLGISEEQFPIRAIDFSRYLESVDTRSTVSILTKGSWEEIPNRSGLKIVDTYMDSYNRVTSSGWEFYTALRGLNYDTPQNFLRFIIDEVLQQLVKQNVITQEEAELLKPLILNYGIAFIPTYYDPIQYYKTIESQRALLIAA